MTTTPGDDSWMWTLDVAEEQLVEALEHGTAWASGADSVEDQTWVVAAADVWDDLGCALVLERPDAGPASWRGTQTQVVADQLLGYALTASTSGGVEPSTVWAACVAVLCSHQADRLQLVHRPPSRDLVRGLTITVPPSGLVAFACPVVHHTDSVLLVALAADGARLSEETHWPLLDDDRHWPDESLWTGYDGW